MVYKSRAVACSFEATEEVAAEPCTSGEDTSAHQERPCPCPSFEDRTGQDSHLGNLVETDAMLEFSQNCHLQGKDQSFQEGEAEKYFGTGVLGAWEACWADPVDIPPLPSAVLG